MRPGRTPENMPFHDLPLDVDGKELIPWPHFQQIEWHHRWDPPHEHPIPMEEFIELNGGKFHVKCNTAFFSPQAMIAYDSMITRCRNLRVQDF